MRLAMLRSLSAGLLGGSLVASGIGVGTTDAAAPNVEPAIGPPAGGARPDAAPATIGTYQACSALFPFESKEDLAVIEVAVEAGSGVLPDPLPAVPTEIVPVVQIGEVECVPDLAWNGQAEMLGFVFGFFEEINPFLEDPDKLIPLPEGTHIAVPVQLFQPETVGPLVVDPTVTIRFEHDLGDDITVSSDPTDISDAWVPFAEFVNSELTGNAENINESARDRVAVVDPAAALLLAQLQIDFTNEPSCDFEPADLTVMIAAIEDTFGWNFEGVDEGVDDCGVLIFGWVISLISLPIVTTIDGLQVVTVTLDGPTPPPATTTTTTTTTTPTTTTTTLPAATTTTVDPSLGVLPPTGAGPNWSALIAGLLTALGVSGLLTSRRRPLRR
ncbi:MAG: hypothetical protein ACO4AY_08455 [Ilumatobacteraceae bacterium]